MENPKETPNPHHHPNKNNRRRRLVLFPLPLQGHISPMLQLANILDSRGGFSITIIHTRFNPPAQSNYPHFTFIPISDGLSDSEPPTLDVSLLSFLNSSCVAPLRDCLAGLMADQEEEEEKGPVACLITDAIWHFSQSVADGLKLPRVVLRTGSIASFLAFAAFPVLREKGYIPKQDSQLESPVLELPPLKVKDLPTIAKNVTEDFYQLIGNAVKETKASSGLIWNTFEELEQSVLVTAREEFPVPSFLIGPFHKSFPASSSSLLAQDQSCISWLNTQAPKSVLYVSFGSVVVMDGNEFLEMASGLANSMQPFLWVVRPGLVHSSEWLDLLPPGFVEAIAGRGHIVKWAPQHEVLAHTSTGGFWTHNGWNSTLESICEGVPMICSPNFGDQSVNAKYVTDVWRIGLTFENGLERVAVEKMIRRLMVEREGQEMRERILGMKEKVDVCLKQGGSSYRYLDSLVSYILSF